MLLESLLDRALDGYCNEVGSLSFLVGVLFSMFPDESQKVVRYDCRKTTHDRDEREGMRRSRVVEGVERGRKIKERKRSDIKKKKKVRTSSS